MKNVKMVFLDNAKLNELIATKGESNNIFIAIDMECGDSAWIEINKETAIALRDELDMQISNLMD